MTSDFIKVGEIEIKTSDIKSYKINFEPAETTAADKARAKYYYENN